MDNMPADTLEAFIFVIAAPEPVKLVAVKLVADIVVPVKVPESVPPASGKKLLNVELNETPDLYNSPAFKFKLPPTSSGYVADIGTPTPNFVTVTLVDDNVFVVLFHDKFGDCKIDVAALPIND